MKTINATVIDSGPGKGQQLLVFALGKINQFGKLRGGIYVGCVGENGETHFAESLQQISHMNVKIVKTLKFMRENTTMTDWYDGQERGKIMNELSEMRDLMIRLGIGDDCHLEVPNFPKDDYDQPVEASEPDQSQAQAVTRPIPAPRKKVSAAIASIPGPRTHLGPPNPPSVSDMEEYYEKKWPDPAPTISPAYRRAMDAYYEKHQIN